MWLAWIGAGALWLLLGFKLDPDAASGSEQAGYVVGGYAFTLAAAAVIRGVYYFVRRREVRFWSPWLLVIAAGFGFLGKVSDIGEAAQRSQDVARVEARVPGEESKAVKECIGGGVQRYSEATPEQRELLSLNDWEQLIGRACKEFERRGLFENEELDQAKLTAIVEEVFVEMQESGELSSS